MDHVHPIQGSHGKRENLLCGGSCGFVEAKPAAKRFDGFILGDPAFCEAVPKCDVMLGAKPVVKGNRCQGAQHQCSEHQFFLVLRV